jgi:hypothetical protein
MNMEEWQRKLKAEKEAARKKKSESAEILHGYRGDLKDDELKLKAIREEERKKAQDAQQILHSYKGAQLLDGVKSKEQRTEQHFPTPVNAGQGLHRDDVLDNIVQGSVSERAAALAAAAAAEGSTTAVPIPSASSSSIHSTTSRNPVTSDNSTAAPNQDNVHVSVRADDDDDDDDDDDFGPSLHPIQSKTTESNPSLLQQQSPPELLSSPIASTAAATTTTTTTTTTSSNPSLVSDNIEPKISTPIEESVMVEKPLETMISNGTSAAAAALDTPTFQEPLQRMDILLAFGLVTISSPPNLESYMMAVQKIASTAIQEKNEEGAIMDPNCPPYVKETKWDGTLLLNTIRCFLVVTSSLFLSDTLRNVLSSCCWKK